MFIGERRELEQKVEESGIARRAAVAQLNRLRTRYAKERNLFSPGIEFVLKLLEDFNPESAREWLRGFDAAREVTEIGEPLNRQGELFGQERKEEMAGGLAEAAA